VLVATLAALACKKSEPHPVVIDSHGPVLTGGGGAGDGGATGDGGNPLVIVPLATGAQGLALDATTLFFSVGGTPGPDDAGPLPPGAIGRVARAGGPASAIVTGGAQPTGVLVVGRRVVWLDVGSGNGSVFALDLSAGASATVQTLAKDLDHPSAIATDGTFVYVAARSAASGVEIDRVPATGGAALTNVTRFAGTVAPAGLAVDAGDAFLVVDGVVGGSLLRVAASGGANADIVWDGANGVPTDVVVTGGRAWVTVDADPDHGGQVVAVPITGAQAVVVADRQTHATHIARDDTNVYFAADGEIRRLPLAATSAEEPVSLGAVAGVAALAVGDAVYAATSSGVVRVPK